MTREPILVEREKTHGDFKLTAEYAQGLKTKMAFNRLSRNDRHNEVLDMIATKIARIIVGNDNCKDHWRDIAGYAKLGEEACNE